MKRLSTHVLLLALFIAVGAGSLYGMITSGASEEKTLTPELELRLELEQTRQQRDRLLITVDGLTFKLKGLEQTVESLLTERASSTVAQANERWTALERDLVKALGGDYDKGDRFDPQSKTLKKAAAPAAGK